MVLAFLTRALTEKLRDRAVVVSPSDRKNPIVSDRDSITPQQSRQLEPATAGAITAALGDWSQSEQLADQPGSHFEVPLSRYSARRLNAPLSFLI
jgi:hypothetical protein